MLNSISTIQNAQNFSEIDNDQISSERLRYKKNVQFNLNNPNHTPSNFQHRTQNFQKFSNSKHIKKRKSSEITLTDTTNINEIKNLDRWVDKVLTIKGKESIENIFFHLFSNY